MSQILRSVCHVWISQVLGSVSAILNISGLKICVFCVEYLSPQDLCHPLVKISDLECCVNRKEYLRFWSLCQMCKISQSLKSVSHMPENSESQVCVNVMNTSILLICVKRLEYLRVSSLCLMCRISQKISICLSYWKFSHWILCLACWMSQVLRSVSFVLIISEL